MTTWGIFAVLVIGVPVLLIGLAAMLPCEGCRLRRERIARGLDKLRARNQNQNG
jgi:hypothetical protein